MNWVILLVAVALIGWAISKRRVSKARWQVWVFVLAGMVGFGALGNLDGANKAVPTATSRVETNSPQVKAQRPKAVLLSMDAVMAGAVRNVIPHNDLTKDGNALLETDYTDAGKVKLSVEAEDNLTHGMVASGINMDTAKIMQNLFRDGRIKDAEILWYYPITDAYGPQMNVQVVDVEWGRSTYSQVDWGNFDFSNVPKISDLYSVNPVFK